MTNQQGAPEALTVVAPTKAQIIEGLRAVQSGIGPRRPEIYDQPDRNRWDYIDAACAALVEAQQPATVQPVAQQGAATNDADAEEVDAVIACLGDDAATLREQNPECEMAANMDRAAELLALRTQQPAPSAAAAVVVYEQKENEMQVWFRPARMHGHPERTPIKATITKDRGNGIVDLTYDDGEFSGNARAVPNALRLPRNVREQVAVWWDVGFEMDFQTAVDNSLKKKKDDPPPQPSPTPQAPFQQRVQPWLLECFGAAIAADRVERNHRFLEESLELVQALGCTASEAHQLVDYVFGRPVGDPPQEVGGVMVTLAALCLATAAYVQWQELRSEMGELIRRFYTAAPQPSPTAQAAQAAQAAESVPAPIDMVLHCPACGLQHIDASEPPVEFEPGAAQWNNPPHRSHLCHGCGHIWRPADVPTNGVKAVKTTGKADSPIAARAPAESVGRDAERLEQIADAIRDYHYALDTRKHGGVAESAAFNSICLTMGMQWEQGKEAVRRTALAANGDKR